MINARFDVNLDVNNIGARHDRAKERAQFELDQQILKDSNNFIPKDTGNLERSGVMHTNPGSGFVEWQTPYARRLYYNPQYNFSKDSNPMAQGLWYEAAKAINGQAWAALAKRTYGRYFGG